MSEASPEPAVSAPASDCQEDPGRQREPRESPRSDLEMGGFPKPAEAHDRSLPGVSTDPPAPIAEVIRQSPHAVPEHVRGLQDELVTEEQVDRRLAEIEMLGEEVAAGWKPSPYHPLSREVRYLHVSRTIHQLVTDRNRSVGIFLAVASILVAAATGMLNIKPEVVPIVPLALIQYWCLPATFLTLAVLAVFISVLLIRARIGLIYEVTKLNTLLGLPSKRVERVNPLSLFYVMHLLVVVLGGMAAGLAAFALAYDLFDDGIVGIDQNPNDSQASLVACAGIGVAILLIFVGTLQSLYYITILRHTTDAKLDAARK
jgi:hypothetical protein